MTSLTLHNQVATGNKAPFLPTIIWGGGFTGGSVPHTTSIGTTLGTVGATDPDGDSITYAIHSDPDSVFSLSGASLKLAASVSASSQHSVVIRATDTHSAYVDQTITISVT